MITAMKTPPKEETEQHRADRIVREVCDELMDEFSYIPHLVGRNEPTQLAVATRMTISNAMSMFYIGEVRCYIPSRLQTSFHTGLWGRMS